jgi:antitoxin YefM
MTKIELSPTQWLEGTLLEIIMLVDPANEEDETTYLLKSEANKKHLLKALDNVKKGNLIEVNIDDLEKNFI